MKTVNDKRIPNFTWSDAILVGWAPRSRLPVSVWADRFRLLQREYSAESGPYRTSRVPYLRDFLDAFGDPNIRLICLTKAARIGGTEAVNNMLGYAIDEEPGPLIYVYPTQDDAEEECRDRLVPFIQASPRLASHIPHSGWSSKDTLRLDTMNVYMAWAKSPRTLIRRTCRYFFIDELDNCDKQSGSLGDTLMLTQKRVITFRDRAKGVIVATPTDEEGGVYRCYSQSDKRSYHVPCPKCGTYQVLAFSQLKVMPADCRDPDAIEIDGLARYECVGCKAHLDDRKHKSWMVSRGVWLPEGRTITQKLPVSRRSIVGRAVFDAVDRWLPKMNGKGRRTRIAGFHVNCLVSPFVRWSEALAEFFRAEAALKRGDPETMRVFVNAMLGEPWRQAVDEIKPDIIAAKRDAATHDRDVVPADAVYLMASADVQQDHLYYVVRAWGYGRTSWLIREGVAEDFEDLHTMVMQGFPRAGTDGRDRLLPSYLAIDSGFRTFEVYDFASTHPGVVPVKGQQTADYRVRPKNIKYSPRGRLTERSVLLWHVNTTLYKELLSRMIRTPDGVSGVWNVNRDVSDDYCTQVTAERQVWKTVTQGSARRRKLVWEPRTAHAANHYLDAEVYGLAIADQKGMLSLKPPISQPLNATTPAQDHRRLGRGAMGWKKR